MEFSDACECDEFVELECLESPTSSYKRIQIWSDLETRQLLDSYANYMSEIGPLKKLKTKKDMWAKIASEIPEKTAKQCEERYKTVFRRKKLAVDNKASGSKRIDFEEDLIESSTPSYKRIQIWSDRETRQLLDSYANYLSEIGPLKKLKTKKDMWAKIASEIPEKTAKQCEERYKTVFRRKKLAVDNKASSLKTIDFEEELLESPTSSSKRIQIWTDGETRQLLNSYTNYMSEIGPLNKFKTKKDMWDKIASEITEKTAKQCEERYKTVSRRKKLAVDSKKVSVSKTIDFEEELLEPPTSSYRRIKIWSDEETRQLFDTHANYMSEIGPFKKFRTKKEMWAEIASKIPEKTAKQCEERYKTVLRRKKLAVDNNKASGSKRKSIDFEGELTKICLMDDFIEPEVEMSSNKCIKVEKSKKIKVEKPMIRSKTVLETLLEIAEKKEAARERRHREKMDLLKKTIRKINNKR